jgi:hypothetical protein
MWVINDNEVHLLAMNGIDRVFLKELPGGIENELMKPPEFNIPCAAFNYLYRPQD